MRILLYIYTFLVVVTSGKSQDFHFEAELEKADSNQYVKIPLNPVMVSLLNRNETDLRIYDSEGKEIPYLLEWASDSINYNFEEIPEVTFEQHDNASTKKTTLEINLQRPYKINKIEFDMEAPVHFKRWGEIIGFEIEDAHGRRRKRRRQEIHTPIELSSDEPLSYDLPELKSKRLLISVNNEDNPPVKFKRVRLLQIKHYLITYLERGKHYSIKYGNRSISFPDYDLRFFKSQIPKNLTILKAINHHTIEAQPSNVELPFYKSKVFLWTSIIVVISFLAFISVKMVKDLSKG